MQITYPKHSAQLLRKTCNMSKSIKLDIKKYCNRSIRKISKDPKMSNRTKTMLIATYEDIKKQFTKN